MSLANIQFCPWVMSSVKWVEFDNTMTLNLPWLCFQWILDNQRLTPASESVVASAAVESYATTVLCFWIREFLYSTMWILQFHDMNQCNIWVLTQKHTLYSVCCFVAAQTLMILPIFYRLFIDLSQSISIPLQSDETFFNLLS